MKTPESAEGESEGLAGVEVEDADAEAEIDEDTGGETTIELDANPDEDVVEDAAIGDNKDGEKASDVGATEVAVTTTVSVTVEPPADEDTGAAS